MVKMKLFRFSAFKFLNNVLEFFFECLNISIEQRSKAMLKINEHTHRIYSSIRFILFRILPHFVLIYEFRRRAGYWPNLKNPTSYNEKIQWLKLNWFDSNATICADKFTVRDFVEKRGLAHILNDLYGVFDSINDLDVKVLPNEFVIKVTHGCGQNLICFDKNEMNWSVEFKKIKKWLKRSHYLDSLEWVYKDIKPRIIVEKLIKTEDGKSPKDYKIFCFHGEPRFLFVATDRGENTTRFDFYDLEWNHIPVKNHYPNSNKKIDKPIELSEMLEYSRILSRGFPHVRIDFYIEQQKVIFGEFTFFHFSGNEPFEPKCYDFEFGRFLNLSYLEK